MDLTPLHPGAAHATTGTARRRDDGDSGFRGVMELMAHFSPTEPDRSDEPHRSEGRREKPADAPRSVDEPREADADEAHAADQAADVNDAAKSRRRHAHGPVELVALPVVPPPITAPAFIGATVAATPPSVQPTAPAGTGPDLPPVPTSTSTSTSTPAAAPIPAVPPSATGRGADTNSPNTAPAAVEIPPRSTAPAAQPTLTAPMSAPASVPQVNAGNRSGAASAAAAGASNLGSANPAATFTAASRTSSDPAKAHGSFESLGDAKVSVETAPVAARTQGVSSAVLVQAHMAVAGEAGPKAAGSAAASSGAALHVGGGQPLFVGSDGGNAQSGNQSGGNGGDGQAGGQQNGGQNGGQSGGQQNGGQTAAGGGFAFGAATIGQRGFGGDAARAQFQEILATRTARPPLQGSGSVGASTGSATGSLASTAFTAGPGGPQSTLPTAMASRAEATAQGRPGAASGTAVDQVAVKLAGTAAGGGDRVTIRLNPEELGKVDVKLELGRDGLVRATISAEKPETLDMLQRDSRALEKALQEAGLKTDQGSLSFDLRGGNGQPQGNGDREPALAGSSTPVDDHPDNGDTDTALAGEPGGQRSDGSYDLVA